MRSPTRTIKSSDVARLAGVSRASVSRAFSPGTVITEETRQRVIAAANQLGYRPNAIARSLIMGRSRMIGIVIADLVNPFYAAVLDRLCQALQERGYGSLVLVASEAEGLDALVPRLLSYQVDGIIIAAATLSSQITAESVQAGRRVVLVNRYVHLPDVSAVCCDNLAGGRAIAQHLVDQGCQRPAFMAGVEDTSSSRDRERGFVEVLAASGLALAAREVGRYSYGEATRAARRLLAREGRPDAVFCANDTMALAVIDVARRECALAIPRDLAVVGFDDTPASASSAYDLTSVDQNIPLMTETAVATLLADDGAASRPSRHVFTPCALKVRGSSRRRS